MRYVYTLIDLIAIAIAGCIVIGTNKYLFHESTPIPGLIIGLILYTLLCINGFKADVENLKKQIENSNNGKFSDHSRKL